MNAPSPAAEATPPLVEFEAVSTRTLQHLSLRLGAGLRTVLGVPGDGASDIVALIAGRARPSRGRVRVLGADPSATPTVRRRVGSLFLDESLPPGRSVAASLRLVLEAAAVGGSPEAALDALGAGALVARDPTRLAPEERRAVALAAALTGPREIVVLHEPFVGVGPVVATRVRQALERLAEAAAVIVVTGSIDDAGWTDELALLRDGRFVDGTTPPILPALLGPTTVDLIVRGADVRALAAHLTSTPAVARIALEGDTLRLGGATLEALTTTVTATIAGHGLAIDSLRPDVPPFEAVRAISQRHPRPPAEAPS